MKLVNGLQSVFSLMWTKRPMQLNVLTHNFIHSSINLHIS